MRRLIVVLFLITFLQPFALGAVNSDSGGGELWFSCDSVESCSLTEFQVGDEKISQTVNSASPISPEYVFLEFPMQPAQSEVALIPDTIDEMQIDLRFQDDILGISKPDLKVTLIIADTSTVFELEGSNDFGQTNSGPYTLSGESINHGGDRLLWPGEEIRVLLEFEIDRPGTWELNLRGYSYLFLDIIWSENIQDRDTDEPSSDGSPVVTELDTMHYGALVDDDRDCWTFEVEDHEILRISFTWEEVPSEIEQNHGRPDLILPDRRLAPEPDMETVLENGEKRITWQWRALPVGEYDLCIGGKLNSFQPYEWIGLISFESLGPTSPDQFNYESWKWGGYGMKASDFGKEDLTPSSVLIYLIISLSLLIGLSLHIRLETTSKTMKYGVFVPGAVIILLSGIVSPFWTMSEEFKSEDEMSLDELVDVRLEQLWHASHPSTPASSRALHVGATFGMLPGEQMSLYLKSDSAWPLDDGRWQLHIPEIYDLDIEQLIFSKVMEKVGINPTDDLLDPHSQSFILLAARTMILDLLILEALLIVDELPNSNVIRIDTEMTSSASLGSVQDPAWATRPVDIPEGRWRLMQNNLYPSLISITMLDGDVDDLEFRIKLGYDISHEMLFASEAIQPVDSLIDYQLVWLISGIFLIGAGVYYENNRRRGAKKALRSIIGDNQWID